MSEVFNVFAYERGHPDERDINRRCVPLWRIGSCVHWLNEQGFDSILIEKVIDGKPSSSPISTHHVCRDPGCPGGC